MNMCLWLVNNGLLNKILNAGCGCSCVCDCDFGHGCGYKMMTMMMMMMIHHNHFDKITNKQLTKQPSNQQLNYGV